MIADLELDTTTTYRSELAIARDSPHDRLLAEERRRLTLRVRGEFTEMPGLRLSVRQAARLFGVTSDIARSVLDELREASVLTCSDRDIYSLNR